MCRISFLKEQTASMKKRLIVFAIALYVSGTLGLDVEGNCYCVSPENREKSVGHVLVIAFH